MHNVPASELPYLHLVQKELSSEGIGQTNLFGNLCEALACLLLGSYHFGYSFDLHCTTSANQVQSEGVLMANL